MKQPRIILALIIVFALCSIGIAWMLPVPSTFAQSANDFRLAFGVANFSNVLSVGTALLFLTGLKGFKQELKTAYYFICAGLFIQVTGTALYSVRTYIAPVERNLAGDLPITLGAAGMFIGIWLLAGMLHVPGRRLRHPAVIVAFLVITSSLLWALPHGSPTLSERIIQTNHVVEALFYPLASILLWQIIRATSHSYARSFRWMFVAVAGNFIAAALFIGNQYITYPAWATQEMLGSLFVIDTLLYVAAGYSFATIQQRMRARQSANSTIDVVIFVASLASQQKDIDPILDELRTLTSEQRLGSTALSPEQEKRLTAIYYHLEDYLVTKEPLRSFTRDAVRQLVQQKFERLPMDVPPQATTTSTNVPTHPVMP